MESLAQTVILAAQTLILFAVLSDSASINNTETLKLCDIIIHKDKTSEIKCMVGQNQALDYRTIRDRIVKENKKFSVSINCTSGGLVGLPWPMKAKNVVEITVIGCKIDGFLSEMTVQHTAADELRSLLLSDVSIEIPLSDLYHLSVHPDKITRDADCGQLTLESITFRNIHFQLEMTTEERQGRGNEMLHFGGHNDKLHPHTTTCVYSKLEYLEETASRVMGHYYLRLIPDHSEFPRLEVYNVSNNNLDHVPHELRHLVSKKFPLLKRIDLSNNALSAFEFVVPEKSNVKMVDLQNNQISSLPPITVKKLKRIGTIFVDLRRNPLICSCTLSPLRRYLQLQYESAKDVKTRKQVSDITCKRPCVKHGKHRQLSLLDPNFDKHCAEQECHNSNSVKS